MRFWARQIAAMAVPLCLLGEVLPIQPFTTTDGLASNQINSIVADSHGLVWFCTPEGLSRFDGHRIVTFGVADGLPSQDVGALLETRSGEYLIGTSGGLCGFQAGRGGKFVPYPNGSSRAGNYILALMQDSAGRIWCATAAGLFEVLGGHQFRPLPLSPGQSHIQINDLAEDAAHNLWVATRSGVFIIGKTGVEHILLGERTENVRALLADRDGGVWAGTQEGLMLLRHAGGPGGVARINKEIDGLKLDLTSLAHGPDGALWGGASEGIVRSIPGVRPEAFRIMTRAQGLTDRQVNALAMDRAGNMWVGSEAAGVMKIQATGFTTFDTRDGLKSDRIWALLPDRDGTVVPVASGAWAHAFDGTKFHPLAVPVFSKSASWGHHILIEARDGAWWAATDYGLYRYAPGKTATLAGKQPQARYANGAAIFQIFEDSKGRIWAAATFGGAEQLLCWDPATKAVSQVKGGPTEREPVRAFAEDRDGNVWMCLFSGAVLLRYDGHRFTRFAQRDGVPAGPIVDLFGDSSGRLWVASANGLGLVEHPGDAHPAMRVYTTASGLASNIVYVIAEDQAGRIYTGNAKGVDRLDPRTGRVKRFSTADGLGHGRVTAAMCDRSGDLWFATTQGLSRLSQSADRAPSIPSVRIVNAQFGRERYPVSQVGETGIQHADLEPSQNHFQVGFVGFSDEPEVNLRYLYKLEGGESDWQGPSTDHEVNYAELTPGRYRFQVKAVNSAGRVSAEAAEVEFVILPHFWRRWWFLSLLALAAAGLILTLHRLRVARLVELERVRTRIATDLHDDVGASLSRMAILSEVAKRQMAPLNGDAGRILTEIADTSRELVDEMSDIVWSIDPRHGDLQSVVIRIREFGSAVLESQSIRWDFEAPPHEENPKLSPEQRRHIFLIMKEAIHNVAQHAGCSAVSAAIRIEEHHLRAEIRDNGKGFSLDDAAGGHGLVNMRARAAEIGGSCEIVSEPGGGACVTLTVPMHVAHRGA